MKHLWPLYLYLLGGFATVGYIRFIGTPRSLDFLSWNYLNYFIMGGSVALILFGVVACFYLIPMIVVEAVRTVKERYFVFNDSSEGDAE